MKAVEKAILINADLIYTKEHMYHILIKTGNKPFVCPICGRSFNEKGNLTIHYRIHTGERPFKCNFEGCDKAFKSKSNLNDHQKSHFGYK